MDRDRLKDIQTADLAEGQVNEEFVQWLKTKGPSYLLIIMLVIVAYMFLVKYQQGKVAHRAEAWIAYIEASGAGLPASHEDIAQTYSEIDGLQSLGLLSAADGYMRSILIGQTIGSNENITTLMSAEDRVFYLEKADGLYARVIAIDDNSPQATIFSVSALNGRAAVAESGGNIDSARGYYEAVITRSQITYPALAVQAQSRIDSLDVLAEEVVLPTDAEVTARNNQVLERDPTPINTSIDALTVPTETGQ
jgi:hypothetical protein